MTTELTLFASTFTTLLAIVNPLESLPVFLQLVLRIFDVPLSMVRIVGGMILMRVGFGLFEPAEAGAPAGPRRTEATSPLRRSPCR